MIATKTVHLSKKPDIAVPAKSRVTELCGNLCSRCALFRTHSFKKSLFCAPCSVELMLTVVFGVRIFRAFLLHLLLKLLDHRDNLNRGMVAASCDRRGGQEGQKRQHDSHGSGR